MSDVFEFDPNAPVIKHAVIQPIFWGAEWAFPFQSKQADQLVSDLDRVLKGPYMRGLVQYQGIASATMSMVERILVISSPAPGIGQLDIESCVLEAIAAGAMPYADGAPVIYLVFTYSSSWSADDGAGGYHGFGINVTNLTPGTMIWAWVGSANVYTATHEIVETCTDPQLNAYHVFTPPKYADELADECMDVHGYSEGVPVAAYWSKQDGACIIPSRRIKLRLELDECGVGPVQGDFSMVTALPIVEYEPDWIDWAGLKVSLVDPLELAWSIDGYGADIPQPSMSPSVQVYWIHTSSLTPVRILVEAQTTGGAPIYGDLTVTPISQEEAKLRHAACRVRKYLESIHRIPPYFLHKLGPDPVELPTEGDVARLLEQAHQLAAHAESLWQAYDAFEVRNRSRQSGTSTGRHQTPRSEPT